MSTRKNALYNVAYRVFSVFLPLITMPYLARTVGDAGAGLYSYAWSISYLFCLLGLLGLENYGVRAIARVRDDAAALNRTFSEIWKMQRLVAFLSLLGYVGYVGLVAGEEKTIALHLTMMSVSCLVNLDWCLMGLGRFGPIALRNTLVKLLAAAGVFVFVKGPEDLWIYGFLWSLATLLGCLSCCASLRGQVRPVRVSWPAALRHLKPCAVLFLSVLAVNIYRTMDKVMVGALSTWAQNGLYDYAEKIIYCLSGFISAIGTVMLPKAAHLFQQQKKDAVLRQMDVTMQLILCMVSAMAFGVAAVAENFAPLFFGSDFAYAGTLMIPLAFTLVMIGFANVVRTQWILPQNRDGIFVRSVLCGAAVNLTFNALLIPRFGAMGAVAGTLLAEGAVPVVQYVFLRKELPYRRYLGYVLQYAALGFLMLVIVRLLGLLPLGGWAGLAAQTAGGAITYALLCLAWWKISRNRAMLALLRRASPGA